MLQQTVTRCYVPGRNIAESFQESLLDATGRMVVVGKINQFWQFGRIQHVMNLPGVFAGAFQAPQHFD